MEKSMANKLSLHLTEAQASERLSRHLHHLITKQEGFHNRPLVMLCIGSDRYTGDALGPLIGSALNEYAAACSVYGSLDYPVHAGNLVETVNMIYRRYHQPIIVAIDACLGSKNEIGNVEIWEGGLCAGVAVGNKLPSVGHVSVIGVVNAGGQIGYLDLQSTPLSTVMKLSKVISGALITVIHKLTPGTTCPTSYIK